MSAPPAAVQPVDCPYCRRPEPYRVLRAAHYPSAPSEGWVRSHYSASSDVALLDQVVRCARCSLVYLNPRPREDLILAGYQAAVDETFVSQDDHRIRTFRRNLRTVARLAPALAGRRLHVLDVGSAGGAFLEAARREGHDAAGIEPSAALAASARSRYGATVHTGTLENFEAEPSSFDVVTFWDVLEHLVDVHGALAFARRVLRPGGALVVSYPAFDSLERRLMRWRWPFFLSVHLTYFTAPTLSRFLVDHGFSAPREARLRQTLELGYVAQRAAGIVPALSPAARLLGRSPVARAPFSYFMGQRIAVAEVRA